MKKASVVRTPLVAGVVVVLGLLATAATAGMLVSQRHQSAERTLDQRTALALSAVRDETERYRALLDTAAAGLGSRDAMTWDDFDISTSPLANAGLAGVSEVAFVVQGTGKHLPALQQLWRGRGAEGLTMRPTPTGDDQFPVIFSRSLSDHYDHNTPPGVNLALQPDTARALQLARETGQPTISDAYVLTSDRNLPTSQRQQSFTFAAPLWQKSSTVPQFVGWLVLNMRSQDFLNGVLAPVSQGQLDAELLPGPARPAFASYNVPGTPNLRRIEQFVVADQEWTLVVEADSRRLPGASPSLVITVEIAGSLLTLALAGLVQVLATGRARARRAAADIGRAEAESRRQAGLLHAVMTSLCDGVSVIDENSTFLLQNPAAHALFGVDGNAGPPANWQRHFGLFEADGQKPFPVEDMPLIRALQGEPSDGVEMLVRNAVRRDGILVSVSGRPLDPSAGQPGAVAVTRDITELRRYETDLAVFAGVVAHDLKAPLTVIQGKCDLAGYALEDDEPDNVAAALDGIGRTVFRMADMIDTLLTYTTARNSSLNVSTVDLEDLVGEVIHDRTAHLPDTQRPDIQVQPLPAVLADAAMLRHVLDNLIGNALKYVAPHTTPSIEIRHRTAPHGWAAITVADRGIGIPNQHKPAVFDRFHRAHTTSGYAGTGLGLAICKTIVERHGGQITVADNPGGGTCFHFTVPLPDSEQSDGSPRLLDGS